MAIIPLYKDLAYFTAAGTTFTGTSYADIGATSNGLQFLYTAANYDPAPTFYYEADLKQASGAETAYSQLATAAGVAVSSSEITTSSTSQVRLRSSAITLVDATAYKPQFKTSNAAQATTCWCCRIVAIMSGTIVALETEIPVATGLSTVSEAYTSEVTGNDSMAQYQSGDYDGTVTLYYEAMLKRQSTFPNNTGRTSISQGASRNTSSEITTNSTTFVRLRSSAVTGTSNGTMFGVVFYGQVDASKLIITQTGSPTKTVSIFLLSGNGSNNTTSYVRGGNTWRYDTTEWSVSSLTLVGDMSGHRSGSIGSSSYQWYDNTNATALATLVNPSGTTSATVYAANALSTPATTADVIYQAKGDAASVVANYQFVIVRAKITLASAAAALSPFNKPILQAVNRASTY